MTQKINRDQFTGKILLKLWIPALVSAVGLSLADIADAVVVGQKMGVTGLATISICLPIYMVLNVFMFSLGQGGSIRFAKLLGAGKHEEAALCFSRIMYAGLLISVLIAALGNLFLTQVLAFLGTTPADGALFDSCKIYGAIILAGAPAFFLAYMGNYFLISGDKQKLASAGFIVANTVDIALNVLLVLVLDFGVAGAAISTIAGMLIVDVMYIPAYVGKNTFLRFRRCRMDLREVWECFRTGFAIGVSYIFQFIFLLVANNLLLKKAGVAQVAVFDMLQNASYLILYLYEGARKAMTPLVSTYVGEQNRMGERYTLHLTLRWTNAVGFAMIAWFLLFPQSLCALFGLGGGDVPLGMYALRIYSLSAAFAGVNLLLEGYYQACGKEKNAYVLAQLRGGLVLLPCTFLFALLFAGQFWWLFFATEVLTLLLFFLWKRRFGEKDSGIAPERVYQRTIQSQNEDLTPLMDDVEQFCEHFEASMEQQYFVTMTVEEICAAIIRHGFGQAGGGYIQITLIALENKDFELHIRDNAKSFNPFELEAGNDQMDEASLDAMGVSMIEELAKDFFYRQYQGFNSLVVWI